MESAVLLRHVLTDPTDGEFDALPADAEAHQGLAEHRAPAQLDVFRRVQALLRAEPPVGHRDERA